MRGIHFTQMKISPGYNYLFDYAVLNALMAVTS